ncbi:MAG: hypothetical protein CM15mP47_4030 [Methanobacteriota archaeon]|nr:MAG: hypothetical protein CM15mP47_4030 [Euryarchaeota archaeon]
MILLLIVATTGLALKLLSRWEIYCVSIGAIAILINNIQELSKLGRISHIVGNIIPHHSYTNQR